jgi:hypothetical protein
MSFPVADHEVKVVRTIALGKICGIRDGLSVQWSRDYCNKRECCNKSEKK